MSAHFLISAIKEAWRETIAQRLRIEELLQIVQHLERENAALLKEIAPLRETVGVRGDAVTSRDDIDYWSKLVDRADKAVRLETENAALRSLLREAIREHVDPYDLPEGDHYIARVKAALGEGQP